MGPAPVTVDEFDNPDDLELRREIDGEQMQKARTSELIFSIPMLIARLSAVLPLEPGDVIFTGTPAGVGAGRTPKRFIRSRRATNARLARSMTGGAGCCIGIRRFASRWWIAASAVTPFVGHDGPMRWEARPTNREAACFARTPTPSPHVTAPLRRSSSGGSNGTPRTTTSSRANRMRDRRAEVRLTGSPYRWIFGGYYRDPCI